jgi:hypothetical protein
MRLGTNANSVVWWYIKFVDRINWGQITDSHLDGSCIELTPSLIFPSSSACRPAYAAPLASMHVVDIASFLPPAGCSWAPEKEFWCVLLREARHNKPRTAHEVVIVMCNAAGPLHSRLWWASTAGGPELRPTELREFLRRMDVNSRGGI